MSSEKQEGVLAAAIKNRQREREESERESEWTPAMEQALKNATLEGLLAEIGRRGVTPDLAATVKLSLAQIQAMKEAAQTTDPQVVEALAILTRAAREAGAALVRGEREEA